MAQATDGIRLEPGETIDWIVLDRPEAANAFSGKMLERFSTVLAERRDIGAPVLGIRGAGKGFGAGMDLGEYNANGSAMDDVLRLSSCVERWTAVWRHPKPVIIAVHGYCIGVAAQLATFADILIVSETATISEPTIPIGGGFIAPIWTAQVGARRAKEFAFLPGNRIDGKTAVEWGWANAAVPEDQLVACAEAFATRMAQVPASVLAMKKRSVNRAMEATGFAAGLGALAESDAILHLEPEVRAIRERLRTEGLKPVAESFAGPSSQDIFRHYGSTTTTAS